MVESGGGEGVGASWAGESCIDALGWHRWWSCAAGLASLGARWCCVVWVVGKWGELLLPGGSALEVGRLGNAGLVCH